VGALPLAARITRQHHISEARDTLNLSPGTLSALEHRLREIQAMHHLDMPGLEQRLASIFKANAPSQQPPAEVRPTDTTNEDCAATEPPARPMSPATHLEDHNSTHGPKQLLK
jgi:hypothetical protein